MKIIIAETAGFCMGVKRAVDLAVDTAAASHAPIFTLGPLIHNNQTLEMLKARGVNLLDESKPLTDPSTIIIRAHGIPPEKQLEIENSCHTIIDGTCPKVKTVHKVIQKHRSQGYRIVITGDAGHAEVIGLLGYAGDDAILIDSAAAVSTLPRMEKICLVSQTTFSSTEFDAVAEALRTKFTECDIVIKKTICAATHKRQEEVEKLASQVEALIVVGGKNSANTVRLAEIARAKGIAVQHVETEEELDWEKLGNCATVGVTAGASTPGWMIKRTVDWIVLMDKQHRRSLRSLTVKGIQRLGDLNVFVALGGVAMYAASCAVQRLPLEPAGGVITFLYLISMYLWNGLACAEKDRHLDLARYQFYARNRALLTTLTLASILLLLAIAAANSPALFALVLIPTIGGILYQSTIVPRSLQKFIRWRRLQDIPTSRDLFVAIAWGVLITLIPHAMSSHFVLAPSTTGIFLWTFFLSYLRSVIFDLRDIEGDRIMGRETLVTVVGDDTARRLIDRALAGAALMLLCAALLFALPWSMHDMSNAAAILLQLPVLLYGKLFMEAQARFSRRNSVLFGVLGDVPFYLSGIGAIAARFFL